MATSGCLLSGESQAGACKETLEPFVEKEVTQTYPRLTELLRFTAGTHRKDLTEPIC